MNALKSGCGIFVWDGATIVSHRGPDALDLLHRLTTKDVLSVQPGHSRRTALTSDRGRVVDVFLVANTLEPEDELILISDSPNSERLISVIDYYTIIEDAKLENMSHWSTRISLVGPRAIEIANSVFGITVELDSVTTVLRGSDLIIVVSDSSRGVEWVDVTFDNEYCVQITSELVDAGGVAIDTAHFELFRIDNEIPSSDKEYGEHSNPIEAGLLDLVDWDKGCYVGQEVIARLDAYDKVQRNLKVLKSDVPLKEGVKLTSAGKPAGVITSSSVLDNEDGIYMGLALVRVAFIDSGTILNAEGTPAAVR
jgi:folate-binding protein YgfZ